MLDYIIFGSITQVAKNTLHWEFYRCLVSNFDHITFSLTICHDSASRNSGSGSREGCNAAGGYSQTCLLLS